MKHRTDNTTETGSSEARNDVLPTRRASSTLHVRQRLIVLLASAGAVLLLVLDLVLQTIAERIDSDNLVWVQIVRLFDLSSESSIPTWYSVILLFFAALIALAVAISRRQAGDAFSRHWFLFALLIFGFSLDESAQIHDAPSREPLRDVLGTGGLLYYPWVVGAVVAGLVVGLLAFNFFRSLPRRTAALLILSALLFAGGAIGLETLSGWYLSRHDDQGDLVSTTISSFEEFFEVAGVVALIYALLDYAGNYVVRSEILWSGASEMHRE